MQKPLLRRSLATPKTAKHKRADMLILGVSRSIMLIHKEDKNERKVLLHRATPLHGPVVLHCECVHQLIPKRVDTNCYNSNPAYRNVISIF